MALNFIYKIRIPLYILNNFLYAFIMGTHNVKKKNVIDKGNMFVLFLFFANIITILWFSPLANLFPNTDFWFNAYLQIFVIWGILINPILSFFSVIYLLVYLRNQKLTKKWKLIIYFSLIIPSLSLGYYVYLFGINSIIQFFHSS